MAERSAHNALVEGSIPSTSTNNALVGQSEESAGLNPAQCGFEPHRGHHSYEITWRSSSGKDP